MADNQRHIKGYSMRLFFIILTTFLTSQISYSQTAFRPGYIITNANDTVSGFIDYREGSKGYRSCDFKNTDSQSAIIYNPGDIVGYGFENDKFYQSREITIKDQPSQVFFIEVIVRDYVSLYRFQSRFFVEKSNEGLQELTNETKEVFVNDQKMLRSSNQYIRTLNMLLFDCEELRSRIEKVDLEEKKLTKLIVAYNRCKGESNVAFKEEKPWSKMNIGIMSGLNISKLDYDKPIGYGTEVSPFEISKSPIIGATFNVSFPRLTEQFSLHGDVLYLKSSYYNYSVIPRAHRTHRNYVNIDFQQFKIPLGIRYTFIKNDFIPYLSFGGLVNLNFNTYSKSVLEEETPNGIVQTFEDEIMKVDANQFGIWGGAGILKSVSPKLTIFLEFRYERTHGIYRDLNLVNYYLDPGSRIQNFQIFIGLRTK